MAFSSWTRSLKRDGLLILNSLSETRWPSHLGLTPTSCRPETCDSSFVPQTRPDVDGGEAAAAPQIPPADRPIGLPTPPRRPSNSRCRRPRARIIQRKIKDTEDRSPPCRTEACLATCPGQVWEAWQWEEAQARGAIVVVTHSSWAGVQTQGMTSHRQDTCSHLVGR